MTNGVKPGNDPQFYFVGDSPLAHYLKNIANSNKTKCTIVMSRSFYIAK